MIEWRKIPYIPERYEVSNTGLVRLLPREITVARKGGINFVRQLEGHILNIRVRDNGKSKGHPIVTLSSAKGDSLSMGETRISLLVARAFHGCPYVPGDLKECQKWRILHRDGDVTNNHADNLDWIANVGPDDADSRQMYLSNIRKLEERRNEPVEDWIKRMWGEDALDEEAATEAA